MTGMKVVVVDNAANGNIIIDDLWAKVDKQKDNLAVLIVTYPSIFGVFEERIQDAIQVVHNAGGQVFMDKADMNAQVGVTSPGYIGADDCHLNFHKTFYIPHGGGVPGVGSIRVAEYLVPYSPGNVVDLAAVGPLCGSNLCQPRSNETVAGSPFGSAAISPISRI